MDLPQDFGTNSGATSISMMNKVKNSKICVQCLHIMSNCLDIFTALLFWRKTTDNQICCTFHQKTLAILPSASLRSFFGLLSLEGTVLLKENGKRKDPPLSLNVAMAEIR